MKNRPTKKRKPKPRDVNQLAFSIVEELTSEGSSVTESEPALNSSRVARGRLGGLKGGPARAAKTSKQNLSQIGKKGAAVRWSKTKP